MGKQWSTCARCGRPYQTVTGLPCGMGDCGSKGGSGSKGQPKGRNRQTTKGTPPTKERGGGSDYTVHKTGCLESMGFLLTIGGLMTAALVKLVRQLTR
jgi:hypothetical protein